MEKKSALVLLTNGSEEMEVVITVDVLRRAEINVTVAGVDLVPSSGNLGPAHCSRGVQIQPDINFSDLDSTKRRGYDAYIVPGGMAGAQSLAANAQVQTLLSGAFRDGKFVCAICAGPLAIKAANIAKGKTLTSHPSVQQQLEGDYNYSESRVVVDDNLVTSRGPGTAFLFALTIVKLLCGQKVVDNISPPMLLPPSL
ncbi:uncharacterized protein VTP21DRAFT_4526 [Calcarisporiella thermophila]|uniref:uncharacterized protein n=1 Tax=Calcarisporiella thermophila TaxID=911321 RepID=UPI003744443E